MKNQLSTLLEQEMDRGQFIRYVGIGAMMLLGGNAIMQALGAMGSKHTAGNRSGYGYGKSPYGGGRE
jgi:hypothetical protein